MITKTKGYRKGNLTLAICEAIELWLKYTQETLGKEADIRLGWADGDGKTRVE